MPPRTARRKKKVAAVSSDEETVEVEDKVVVVDDLDDLEESEEEKPKKKTKKRKKKKDDSEEEKPKKKKSSAGSSSTTAETPSNNVAMEDIVEEEEIVDTKEEEELVSLDTIKSDNEFVMQAVDHVSQSINFLDSTERNYATIPAAERQTMRHILKMLQKRVGKLLDLCSSAELLLFRGSNHDMSEYGLLNTVQLPEIWATVFSFLNFPDYLKASQVCKTWQTASLHAHALTSFHLDFNVDYTLLHYVDVYKKYISWRLEHIKTVWDLPMRLLRWLVDNEIKFPNAKYEQVSFNIAWEDLPTYEVSDIGYLFPKQAKKVYEAEFGSLWTFFESTLSSGASKAVVPSKTNIAKVASKTLEFEDPDSIEELIIYKFDEKTMVQFENLKRLDLSYVLRFHDKITSYSFKSEKLTSLCVPYLTTFEETKAVISHIGNIKSLKLVDSGSKHIQPIIISHLDSFSSLTELEVETLTESDLVKVPPSLKRLKIGKITEKNPKIISVLSNIEELHTTEQVLAHINLTRLPKLKTLLIFNNTSNHNKQITIESSTIENLCLLTYNSITIKCPNLYYLKIGTGLKGGSDSVYIKSNQLTHFILERDVQILSIQGPNFVSDGSILDRVKNIVDLECPLIDRAFVKSLSSINQGDSFKTLLMKQIKTLTISVSYFELFTMKTEIQHLNIENWKSSQRISSAKINAYRVNVNNFKTLKIVSCSVDVIKLLNSIFKESTSLETLTIEDTNFDAEYLDTISDPIYYPNLRTLTLANIVAFKPQTGTQFLKTCDNRPLLTRIDLQYKTSYKRKHPTYIPIHCANYTGQLSGCLNDDSLPNLTSITVVSGGMQCVDFTCFKFFPNLKFISLEQIPYIDCSNMDIGILKHCKHLETIVSSLSLPKEFKEQKDVTVVDTAGFI